MVGHTLMAFFALYNTPPFATLPFLSSQQTYCGISSPTPPNLSHSSRSPLILSSSALETGGKKNQIKIMYQGEFAGMQYLTPVSPSPYPAHFGTMQNNVSTFHYSNLLRPYPTPTFQIQAPLPEFPQQAQSLSNNSTSDEADEIQMSVIDERKQRRMISNRESARRSRMRKQRHLDELWSQVLRLRTENRQLLDKLNHVSECHDRVLHENERLKEESSGLRRTLHDLQLDDPYAVLRDMEEVPCNSEQLRAESTNQPDACSVDLLH